MKAFLNLPLSADSLWPFSFTLLGLWLLFHPPLAEPKSLAVALGGGLLLLLWRSLPAESLSLLGFSWVFFLFYALSSSLWSLLPGVTLQSAGFLFLGTLLYLMGRAGGRSTQNRVETAGILLAGGVAFLGLRQWFFGFKEMEQALPQLPVGEAQVLTGAVRLHRAFGPLVTPGALAALLIFFLPQVWIRAWISKGLKRVLFGAITLLLLGGLLSTQGVGAWLCLTMAVLFILAIRRSWKAALVILGLGLAVLAGVLWQRGFQDWRASSFDMRLELWRSAWGLFLKHPLLGSGLGTFDEAYRQAGLQLETGSRFAHNLFLQLLVETGLAGFLLFSAALLSFGRRWKPPPHWEGWGVATGALAFFLFSFLDLPFQMAEAVWFFAGISGRLEGKPDPFSLSGSPLLRRSFAANLFPWGEGLGSMSVPSEWVMLGALLATGFWWPPFRPWNFALLAGTVWVLLVLHSSRLERVSLWVFAGALYLALRAFFSPSSLGAVRFLEMGGLLTAFVLCVRSFPNPNRFLGWFCALGVFWALQVWSFSFQYSDIRFWKMFPNPKQVGVFLLPLLFLPFKEFLDFKTLFRGGGSRFQRVQKLVLFVFVGATLLCLKVFSAMMGLVVGFTLLIKKNQRYWAIGVACLLVFLILFFRVMVFSSLDKTPTQWDRVSIWKSALQVWAPHPFLGAGPGTFAGAFHRVKAPREEGISRYLMDAQYAHNEFLELLTAFGLVGFVWVLLFLRKVWPPPGHPGRIAGLAALGTVGLADFCFHTPSIALQGAGLLASTERKEATVSWMGAFLTLGLVLGLFGSAALAPLLRDQAVELEKAGKFPEELRLLEAAERLNAWDARVAWDKALFLERLYSATGDATWKRKSDDAMERTRGLEPTEGDWAWEKAKVLSARVSLEKSQVSLDAALRAWREAEEALPYSAFLCFEEGDFFRREGRNAEASSAFQKAVELEPNYAGAWVNLGNLLAEAADPRKAREAYRRAWEAYHKWKTAERINPLERQLVDLPPPVLDFLRAKVGP